MQDFPAFVKNPSNRIAARDQSPGVEGFVFDGADGSQVAFWRCLTNGSSAEHAHDYDEYVVVIEGRFGVIMADRTVTLEAGDELLIPRGVAHSGEFAAGTRTIHAFGGPRARRG
jgi:mannose-6-phosphate isomerase-like protein (cupin superfamily)